MTETIQSPTETPFSTVGYLVYKRTYSRRLEGTEDTEEFPDTIERVMNACDKQFKCGFTENEASRLRNYMLKLKGIVAGRYLWQAGTPTVDRIGLFSLQNCAYVTVDSPIVPFTWAMDALALGSGVGFNIQRHNVEKLPPVKSWFKGPTRVSDGGADFIVPDSREGWVRLLAKTLKAAFLSEREEKGTFTYSTQVVRSKGTPIKGFGGVACLTGDTVLYKDRKKSQEENEITVGDLYKLQNSLGFWEGKPNHFNKIKLRSLDEGTGAFFRNRVLNVVCNGEAPVYEIITESGYKIKATSNHRFMRDSGDYDYVSNFSEGELIAVNGTDVKPRKACRICGASVAATVSTCHACKLKSKSDGFCKICDTPISKWAAHCKPCTDALQLQDTALDTTARERKACTDYRQAHNTCEVCGCGGRISVHHKDKNTHNNEHDNLVAVCDKCHAAIHANIDSLGDPYGHRYVSFDAIKSIKYAGVETVYDLQMEGPNHNFVANGFVSHNSGPEELVIGINKIAAVLTKRRGKKLRPIDALDIMNIIGEIIVAGNVRRSAMIAIGDPDDVEFLLAKNWNLGNIPSHRAMSNNSVACDDVSELHEYFWKGYEGGSEPYGLINMKLARSCGRLGETQYPDPNIQGFNPCAEQGLEPYETCVTGDTLIPCRDGTHPIADIVGKRVEVFNGVAWSAVTPFVAKQKDSFYKITFSDGSELKANSDHEFQIERNSAKVFRLKTGELKVGDKLPKFELPTTDGVLDENAYTLGAFTGDGYVDNGTCLIHVPESKYGLIPHLKHESVYKEQHREGLESHVRVRTSIGAELGVQLRDREQGLPAFIMNYDKLSALAFIAGVIDTDGTLGKTGTAECYKIYSTSPKKLRDIQILARRAGINSVGVSFHTSKEKKSALCGRNFDLYVLHIASHACVEIPTKLKVATSFGKRFKPHPAFPDITIDTASRVSVRSVEKLEIEEPSYCFSEPIRGMGVFNNVLTYQCNLATIFLPNIKSLEEFKDVATLLYRVNKHSLQLRAHHPETDAVVKKNQRMGISLTGILQCTDEQLGWCDAVYEHLRAFDLRYSMLHGFRPSIKLTTIQPSGCARKDTLLLTGDGILTLEEIGDIEGPQWQPHSIDVSQENSTEKSTKFYVNGIAKTKLITMNSGLELESTCSHQYRVLEKDGSYVWRTADALKIGDKLPYKVGGYVGNAYQPLKKVEVFGSRSVKITQPDFLTEDLAYLLGAYLADGSTHSKGLRIAGNIDTKAENMELLRDIVFDTFNLEGRLCVRAGTKNMDLYLTSQGLLRWFELNGLIKGKSHEIEFPTIVRKSPRSVIKAYIDGFFSGDGHWNKDTTTFCTTSKVFSQQLVVVMRAIGMDAKVKDMPPTVSSYGKRMRYWIAERKGRLAEARYIKSEMKDDWKALDSIGLSSFSIDTVESIEDSECPTYDIEVPENNCYIANSYVSHNTLSLLPGVLPGIHPGYAQYMYRRIRIASGHPLVNLCRDHGYPVEFQKSLDGKDDYNTVVVTFPFAYPEGAKLNSQMSAIDQLKAIKKMQTIWSDNSVSCTVYYKLSELPAIREYLEKNYEHGHKTLSFLLHSGHGFVQAPYEEITKEAYEELVAKTKLITSIGSAEFDGAEECANGACPVR